MTPTEGNIKEIWNWFEQISAIPRCSKNEAVISQWIQGWAGQHNFPTTSDQVGNIIINIPPSPGYENSPSVAIQGHLDMVCEKTPDSTHNFSKDKIRLVRDGAWLKAHNTTLGADNGIGVAMALALASDRSIPHPPLEFLFTVDEEIGLVGASALEENGLASKLLFNLDSEEEGHFTIGCAGGCTTVTTIPLERVPLPENFTAYKLQAGGMKGGHSGTEINTGRANALKILGRALYALSTKMDLKAAHIQGGSAHNAIPRDSQGVIYLENGKEEEALQLIQRLETTVKKEYGAIEPNLFIRMEKGDNNEYSRILSDADLYKLIRYILIIPHGVAAMSKEIEGLVETSNNFASIRMEENRVLVETSQRSSVSSRLQSISDRIDALAQLTGGSTMIKDPYPAWQPNLDSPLLKTAVRLYTELFRKEPVIKSIHAGLECGIIGEKNPGIDMISMGPDIEMAHSPEERLNIESVGKVWNFLTAVLKTLK